MPPRKNIDLRSDLQGIMTVMNPQDAIQPILPPPVRGAILQWMTEIRAEEELRAVKVDPRRSTLLSGPPGCGKTTLAHHLAARLDYDLVLVHMDRLKSMYVGGTGNNIANIFEWLMGNSRDCIVFFDEFDAIATTRTAVGQASDREANAVVDALLQRIESYKGILMAATNMATHIDPAIWRRFGMHLEIPLPGIEERFAIIKMYADPFDLGDEMTDFLAKETENAAPSLLRQLVEGVKRDLVLSRRLNLPDDVVSVFSRIVCSVGPHSDYKPPPLWEYRDIIQKMTCFPWPPQKKDQK